MAIADDLDTPVAETIANVARERHAQVVVVGGHGQSRAREVLLGTITRDVIRRAPCPTLVVRPLTASAPSRTRQAAAR